jgi:hypothetical protein
MCDRLLLFVVMISALVACGSVVGPSTTDALSTDAVVSDHASPGSDTSAATNDQPASCPAPWIADGTGSCHCQRENCGAGQYCCRFVESSPEVTGSFRCTSELLAHWMCARR